MQKDKYDVFVDLATDAIEKCLQQLTKLDPNKDVYEMQQFGRGLALLSKLRNDAREKFLRNLDLPSAKRPGHGLVRGFDEFNCGREVMDAVQTLEIYFHNM